VKKFIATNEIQYLVDEALVIQGYPPALFYFISFRLKAKWEESQKGILGQNLRHFRTNLKAQLWRSVLMAEEGSPRGGRFAELVGEE